MALRAATDPRSGELDRLNRQGNLHLKQGEHDAAVASFRDALALSPNRPEIHFNLGLAYSLIALHEDALAAFERARELKPDFLEASVRAASALERLNRLDQARTAVDRAFALNPKNELAWLIRARLEARSGDLTAARARLETLLDRNPSQACATSAYYDLGGVCDRLNDHAAAFRAAGEGNALVSNTDGAARARSVPYIEQIDRYRDYFTADRLEGWTRSPPPETRANVPVFFVGFPRSGTTLVEQVLGAHPNVFTTDEFPLVGNLILNLEQILKRDVRYPEDLATLDQAEISRLRAWYRWAVRQRFGAWPEGKRLVDKFPLNLVHLGLVRRIFPEAQVIVALRDPRDVCLSCFMQHFSVNAGMVHCLDLHDTANLYVKTMSLWQHYEKALGLDVLVYRYEDVVEDLERIARALFRFLAVPWNDGVLEFHSNAARKLVRTPSYEAVTKPVYKGAVGRWRYYENELRPILPLLEPFVQAFGYAPR